MHGAKNEVKFADKLDLWGTTIVHGHPENTPISSGDALILLSHNARKIIAINKNGEFSSLKYTPLRISKLFNFLPKRLKSYIEQVHDYGIFLHLQRTINEITGKINKEKGLDYLIENIGKIYENADNSLKIIINQ